MTRASWPLVLAFAVVLAGCGEPAAPNSSTTSTTREATPTSSPSLVTPTSAGAPTRASEISGFAPALVQGTTWTFAWTLKESSTVQGSGSSASERSGTFTLRLGEPRTIGGVAAFPVDASGESRADTRDLAPRWRYIAVEGDRLLGSEDGSTLEIVFDGAAGAWKGGGFFANYDDAASVEARAAVAQNEYLDTSAYAITRSTGEGGCVYDRSVGTLCGDSELAFSDTEYHKPGVGPLAYELRVTQSDSGGGFYTAFSDEIHVGLVATTLRATDGWTPRLPPWTQLAPMPTPRDGLAAVAVEGKLYAIGGLVWTAGSWEPSAALDVYDPGSAAWTRATGAVEAIGYPAAATVGGKIYVLDADDIAPSPFQVYDVATARWSQGPELPRGLLNAHAAPFGNDILVVGSAPYSSTGPSNVAFIYDIDEAKWYETTPPPTYRNGYAFASDGRYAYLVGHYYDGRYDGTVHRFDFDPGTWDTTSPMSEARFNGAGAFVDGKILVMGGKIGTRYVRSVESYDPHADEWTTLAPMPTAREGHAAVAIDGMIYVVGGNAGGDGPSAALERLDPSG